MPLIFLLIALLPALVPAAAFGDTRDTIIKDCADDGQLQGDYSKSELRDARQNMPSDVAEYTDCADVLRRAELPDGRGGDAAGAGAAAASGGGGGALLTPADDREGEALRRAMADGGGPVEIDGQSVVPGAAGLSPGAKRNEVPDTLLAALILLIVGGLAAAYPAIRRSPLGRLIRGS